MPTDVRRILIALTACSLIPVDARADLLARMLDANGAGAAPSEDDLLSWSGPTEDSSLPAILAVAVRAAPSLRQAPPAVEVPLLFAEPP